MSGRVFDPEKKRMDIHDQLKDATLFYCVAIKNPLCFNMIRLTEIVLGYTGGILMKKLVLFCLMLTGGGGSFGGESLPCA